MTLTATFQPPALTVNIPTGVPGVSIDTASLGTSISAARLGTSLNPASLIASTGTPVARDYVSLEPYEGDYVVIPQAQEAVVLPTKDKRMTDDVTVQKVPYFETHNEHGSTVYIASEA